MTDPYKNAQQDKTRRGYSTIKAKHPTADGSWDVLISLEKRTATAAKGMGPTKELAYTVQETLARPTAIFRGLRASRKPDWLYYVSCPVECYFHGFDNPVPAPPGDVFLVYVCFPDRFVHHWAWKDEDPQKRGLPLNHRINFNERLL